MNFFKRLTGQPTWLPYTGPAGGSLVVDVETTGLSPDQGHRVTWLGAAIAVDAASAPQPAMSVAVKGTNGLAVFGDAPRRSPPPRPTPTATERSGPDVIDEHHNPIQRDGLPRYGLD